MIVKPKGLPLLARELIEISARRSTYLFRVLMAVALSVAGLIVLADAVGNTNPFRLLGRGRELLEAVVYTEFVYVYALLPVLSAGAFTEEKERDTLSLLLITRLGPWTIVFEKILGRLVPMLAMVLLTVPLLTVAYSLGGVDLSALAGAAWLLILGSLQVITISVMTSALCGKTVVAYLLAWGIGVATASMPLILDEMGVVNMRLEEMMVPPAMFDSMLYRPLSLYWVMTVSIPTLLVCTASVYLTRRFLTRCETQTQKFSVTRWLGLLDSLVREWLSFLFPKRAVTSNERPLPDDRPIYWKETCCDMFNRPRHRTYVSVLGTLVAGIAIVTGAETEGSDGLASVYFMFLAIVCERAVCTQMAVSISRG